MKVIVSAYACSPYKGSEPGVGWGFVKGLAPLHELCVITELGFKEDIDRYLDKHPELARVRFEYVPRIRHRVLERIWPPAYYWTYRRWQQDAYRLAQHLHKEIGFDLAHQLNMIGFREPGYLYKLGIPFVWGPVGGMGLFPWRFLYVVGLHGAFYYLGYNLFNFFHMRLLVRPQQAAKVAGDGLITANTENREGALSFWDADSSIVYPVGPASFSISTVSVRTKNQPLKIVWCGALRPGKALNLALEAVSQISDDIEWELHILGDGPQTTKARLLATSLRVDKNVHFHGWLPRDSAMEVMKGAHLMLFSSLREGTPTVIVEAFSLGLPVVCLDHSGMADMVNDHCGVKIPATTPREVVVGMARAIEQLAQDERERQTLARGALQRARDFAWEEKARVIDRIYRAKVAGVGIAKMSES